MDGWISRGCYGSVVNKKEYYEDLIKRMRSNHERMSKTVEEGQSKIERIMTIKQQSETEVIIGKRLHEIVDSCLEIDLAQANSVYKRQKLENDMVRKQDLTELASRKAAVEEAQRAH